MSEPAALPKLSFTIPEVVKATGVGRTAIYEEIKAGNLEARKRGAQTLILAEELKRFLTALPVAGKESVQ
jgi:excisionase family DNA binding protein